MKLTKLDIDNQEALVLDAEQRQQQKLLDDQCSLLNTAYSLQGELLNVLLRKRATHKQAHSALKGLLETYDSLPYSFR